MTRFLSRVFIVAGLAMLGWCVYVWGDATVAQYAARQSLERPVPVPPPSFISTKGPPAIEEPIPPPAHGAAIAELSIPRVQLSAVVLNGSDARTLRRGPGHLEDTPLPGEGGNIVIAGHRDSFFRQLRFAAVGDDVFLQRWPARFRYRITSLRVVHPHDTTVLAQTDEETLTLITCFPFWVLGDAPDRFVVRAVRMTDDAMPAVSTTAAVPRGDTPVGTTAVAAGAASRIRQARPHDDETLVRDALARFRAAYNARLLSRVETRDVGPLAFADCQVSVDGDTAAAQCEASQAASARGVAPTWSFGLDRDGQEWAIREIVSK